MGDGEAGPVSFHLDFARGAFCEGSGGQPTAPSSSVPIKTPWPTFVSLAPVQNLGPHEVCGRTAMRELVEPTGL